MKSRQLQASEEASFYLVNLLCEFTHTGTDFEPLSLKLARVSETLPEERGQLLKEVGDQSLYMSGFFPDNLSRRLVSVEYYAQLGGGAYRQLAAMPRLGSACLRQVYKELSEKFSAFVSLLHEIRSRMTIYPSTNVLQLYEQWRKTGSRWLEERLRACGVLLPDSISGTTH